MGVLTGSEGQHIPEMGHAVFHARTTRLSSPVRSHNS